jgi:prephenate dehydrogenase
MTHHLAPDAVHVVGGLGRMGALMARLFRDAGLRVRIFDAQNGPVDYQAAAQADLVVIAVPIPQVETVIAHIGPHTRPDGAVMDLTSIKQKPVAAMMTHCRGEVIGGHPLFGPNTDSLDGRTFFLCPSRRPRRVKWVRRFLSARGARVVPIDPQRHDQLMARIQVLRHLFIFSFGQALMKLEFDPAEDSDLSGPWFSELVGQLVNQLRQAPELFADLALFNPAADQVLSAFRSSAEEVGRSFSSGDKDRIVALIQDVSAFIQSPGAAPAAAAGGSG